MRVSQAMESDQTALQRTVTALAVAMQLLAFYAYERHYQMCQSWKGWFICMIGSLVASNAIRQFVTKQSKCEDALPPTTTQPMKALPDAPVSSAVVV